MGKVINVDFRKKNVRHWSKEEWETIIDRSEENDHLRRKLKMARKTITYLRKENDHLRRK